MEDKTNFELPSDCEKLSYKFILDGLKARQVEESSVAPPETPPIPTEALPLAAETQPDSEPARPMRELELPAGKKYFRIGEVAEILGVEPYVLRYWEQEFSAVRPTKSQSGHRVYSRRDIATLHYIEHLLHVERFSIKGAKQKLVERRQRQKASQDPASQKSRELLKEMAQQLRELITIARGNPGLDC